MDYKAIFFDMDGVLIDSSPIHEAAYQKVLGPLGITDFDYTSFKGIPTRNVMATLLKTDCDDPRVEVLKKEKQRLALQGLGGLKVAESVWTVLRRVDAQFSKRALVTGASQESVDAVLKVNNLEGFFQTIITGESTQRGKPHPAPYLTAASQLNVAPSDCLVIEDSNQGIQSALDAGMRVWAVNTNDFLFRDDKRVNYFSNMEDLCF